MIDSLNIVFLLLGALTYALIRIIPVLRRKESWDWKLWYRDNFWVSVVSIIISLIVLIIASHDDSILELMGWKEVRPFTAFGLGFLSDVVVKSLEKMSSRSNRLVAPNDQEKNNKE